MQQQVIKTEYITNGALCQDSTASYLARLADQHQNMASCLSLAKRCIPRNPERIDAAQEALDEVDNEIEALLKARWVGFDTLKVTDFLTAIDAYYSPEQALTIANLGVPPEMVVVAEQAESAPVEEPVEEPVSKQRDSESSYYANLAVGL